MEEDGVWRTVSGRRIFIHNGQSITDAMRDSGKFQNSEEKQEKQEKQIEEDSKLSKEEFQKKYRIEEWEQRMIDDYTGVNYTGINGQLRKNFGEVDKCSLDVQNDCEGIDNVLNKLPKYEGEVHRGEDGSRLYLEGQTYTNYSYTSTTRYEVSEANTWITIKQSNGCLIDKLSRNPGEAEVLLPRGFKWKVTKVEYLDNGHARVYGEEVK